MKTLYKAIYSTVIYAEKQVAEHIADMMLSMSDALNLDNFQEIKDENDLPDGWTFYDYPYIGDDGKPNFFSEDNIEYILKGQNRDPIQEEISELKARIKELESQQTKNK